MKKPKFARPKVKATPLKKAFGTQKALGMPKGPKGPQAAGRAMPAAPPFGRVKQPRGSFGGPPF